MPLRILNFHADTAVLRQRIELRQCEGRDISEADLSVLEHQLDVYSGLDLDEQGYTITIDTQSGYGSEDIMALITQSLM